MDFIGIVNMHLVFLKLVYESIEKIFREFIHFHYIGPTLEPETGVMNFKKKIIAS